MSFPVPVLTGFAGVLVAAVATGVLAGRCVRQPRIDFIVWAGAALALTIALAAQSVGFARGFGPATFRAVQLFGLLLAPLWLAWGLVELVAANEAARFGMRLVSGALTVLGSVVLVTDPLTAQPFSKAWPLSGPYYQPISHDVLGAVQAVAVLAAVASVALAAVRARRDPAWRSAMAAVVSVGAAVLLTAGLRFPLPARAAYPLVSTLAAALVWFGASRLREHPATRRDGRDDGNLSAVSGVITPETADKDGGRDGRGRYRSGDGPDDQGPDDAYVAAGSYGADSDSPPDGQHATYGQRGGAPGPGRARDGLGAGPAARAMNGAGQERHASQGPWPRTPDRPSGPYGPDRGQQAGAGESPAAAPPRPYGRILIFTLLDDRVADFDRLAEQTAEEVSKGEPDNLVYVIHLVPNAPLQRIFYEIYRDRAAFDSHESQPYMQRFVAERRSYVLATNVIELRLKFAKVAALQPSPTRRPPPPARPAAGDRGPAAGARGPAGPARSQPPPPAGPSLAGPPRYDNQRPDQGRPDQRQAPSADRRYGG